jgi:hypothetical protein
MPSAFGGRATIAGTGGGGQVWLGSGSFGWAWGLSGVAPRRATRERIEVVLPGSA